VGNSGGSGVTCGAASCSAGATSCKDAFVCMAILVLCQRPTSLVVQSLTMLIEHLLAIALASLAGRGSPRIKATVVRLPHHQEVCLRCRHACLSLAAAAYAEQATNCRQAACSLKRRADPHRDNIRCAQPNDAAQPILCSMRGGCMTYAVFSPRTLQPLLRANRGCLIWSGMS
jgi:hypothetical protein